MNKTFDEIIGWIGIVLILGAYALVSFEILTGTNIYFQLMNAVGALGVVYISFKKKAYQPGVLNIIWAIIALIAIIGILF